MILAIDSLDTKYLDCAVKLAESIKFWHPNESICLLTDRQPNQHLPQFDIVKTLPYGNRSDNPQWQLENDWQVWAASPYRKTIKLEADMLLTSAIDHWWYILQDRDLLISHGARNYFGEVSDCRFYRKVFDQNHLPDVYNAITYWSRSWLARDFFRLVRTIFENWQQYAKLLKYADDRPTTDLVYAIAAQIIGPDKVIDSKLDFISIVHMKKHIVPTVGLDWTREFVWEFVNDQLRINTVSQSGFFHYHIKSWTNKIEKFTRSH